MGNRKLNIVDEEGNIVGEENRDTIHREGLLHKIVHVWFYTPDSQITFQVRGAKAETHPNLLDATAGGHVEIGQDYMQAAIAETTEETNVHIQSQNLRFLSTKEIGPSRDAVTGRHIYHLVAVFMYMYTGDIANLHGDAHEDGGLRFEAWPIEKLFALTEEQKKRIIPDLLEQDYFEVFKKIREL